MKETIGKKRNFQNFLSFFFPPETEKEGEEQKDQGRKTPPLLPLVKVMESMEN